MKYVESGASPAWQLSQRQPDQWLEWVRTCGGNVFHTRAGLLVDASAGTVVYGWLLSQSGETLGVALGGQRRCRLAFTARHFHCPTLPALAPRVDPDTALSTFKAHLGMMAFAEVTIGSYDAQYSVADGSAPRLEYVLQLPPSGDLTPQLGTTHRRHVRRGEREAWTVRILTGAQAAAAIHDVQQSTTERAGARQRGFAPAHDTGWAGTVVPSLPIPDHGLMVLGGYRDDTLLSSILIGWAAGRAFYLIGGSTPEGYQCGAAVWLHSRAMRILAEQGVRVYNLGGTPLDAAAESSATHGLYRFKTGFGASPVERRGVQWILRPSHTRLHQLLARAAD